MAGRMNTRPSQPGGLRGREDREDDAPSVEVVPPPPGTVEAWAFELITSTDLQAKLCPPPPPDVFEPAAPSRRISTPGRPDQFEILQKAPKSIGPQALRHPERRAQAFHTFLHHELQAAELMAWAVLAFPDSPRAFRRGLLGITMDEVRHMAMYRGHLGTMGHEVGDFPVRDWFWRRVPTARSPAEFVALMGMGLEGSNLDHAARFALKFREFGDEEGARIQEVVAEEEIPHVRFAMHWFEEFTGRRDFDTWARHLPAPITPTMFWQEPVNERDRQRAGMDAEFVARLRQS